MLQMVSGAIQDRQNSLTTTTALADVQMAGPSDSQVTSVVPAPVMKLPDTNETKILPDRLDLIQTKVGEKFDGIAAQIQMTQMQQNNTASAADQLARSLQEALAALKLSQMKHESATQHNDAPLASLMENSQELTAKNVGPGKLSRNQLQALAVQEERRRTLGYQSEMMQRQQWIRNQQIGAQGQSTNQMQQEMAAMREQNRHRMPEPTQSSSDHLPVIQEQTAPIGGASTPAGEGMNRSRQPTETRPTPFAAQPNSHHGFTPVPCTGFPNMIVDVCPGFTPSTYQNWKREIKLWIA